MCKLQYNLLFIIALLTYVKNKIKKKKKKRKK